MPYDPRSFGDDDDSEYQESNGRRRKFREFDCPECSANNPLDDGFGDAAAIERGKALFVEQCAACHGEQGKGTQEMGAPHLTDGIWLYGGQKADIEETIRTGRGGVMPAWDGKLDPVTIKMLAIYVHALGGGK